MRDPGESGGGPLPRRNSLAVETVRALRLAVDGRVWIDFLPGERELCERFQVSRPTLRAALGELELAGEIERSPRWRTRLIQAKGAPTRRAASSRIIAAIAPAPLLSMAPSAVVTVDELRTHLARAGFGFELFVAPACFSKKPERALRELTSRTPAAAWITLGSREPTQRWFHRSGLPCLVAGSCAPGIPLPSVDIDYRAACRHAGALFAKKGHRKVLLCLPESATGGEAESEAGLRESFAGAGADALSVLRHNGTPDHLRALLDEALRSPAPPTGILVARGVHALTTLTHLQRRGKRLPGDVALVSRDDEPFLAHVTPIVARYAVAPGLFPRKLSKAALKLAETGGLPPLAVRLIPEFVPGESL